MPRSPSTSGYTTSPQAQRSAVIAEPVATGRLGVIGLSYRLAEGSVHQEARYGV
jgi:carbonic anhydrase